MSVATVIESGPDRHALLTPECECGGCAPTWARRRGKSRRFVEPVTLLDALLGEAADCRAGMVDEHRECLSTMVAQVDEAMAQAAVDDLGYSGVGLAVVMFAGELASALRAAELGVELPERLVQVCEQTVTGAMLAAASCLAGLSNMVQVLDQLAGY
jgi:hypothetical protein